MPNWVLDAWRRRAVFIIAGTLLCAPELRCEDLDADTFFELKIRPVLHSHCIHCHGSKKATSGLRLDSRADLLRGGIRGPAIVPGNPAGSRVLLVLRYDDPDLKMPLGKPQLAEEVIADFTRWVANGAHWPASTKTTRAEPVPHWAFQLIARRQPRTDITGWAASPVDQFIAAERARHDLQPTTPADRRTLLRRVYFDLIGLPPSSQEIEAFAADAHPNAFERTVDRLLASSHYGERWGRHWMDVVRYADTAGDNADYPIPEARLYRDYIIDSFNHDKPYDEFVREQIAGDLLAQEGPRHKYAERVIATGFVALSRRYATAPYELFHLTLEDTIETVGRAFLGLTLRCARCHDHKFDPVTAADYYGLYGIFSSTSYPYAGSEEFGALRLPREHFVPLIPPSEAGPILAAFKKHIAELDAKVEETKKTDPVAQRISELRKLIAELTRKAENLGQSNAVVSADLKKQLHEATQEKNEKEREFKKTHAKLLDQTWFLRQPGLPPELPAAYAVSDGDVADQAIQHRGDPTDLGRVVKRRAPLFLEGELQIPEGTSGRRELAAWLVRPENPLTARVMVNRVWYHHFGKGLVSTPSNYGRSGERPTHPELLDYLALRFVNSGWSIKTLHKLIVLSKTYQLSSDNVATNVERDPTNRLYWRFDLRRLDAESIRDALLTVSGTLDHKRPGRHPFPPMKDWKWSQHHPFKKAYPSVHRSVYLMTQRLQRHPYLGLFDSPDTNMTTAARTSSTVPLQALYLMNNPFVRSVAENFSTRVRAGDVSITESVTQAYRLAYGRAALAAEVQNSLRHIQEYRAASEEAGGTSAEAESEAWLSFCRVLLTANEFFYLD